MNKKLIRLTESDLHRIIKESVNEVLNELGDSDRIHNYLGTISGYYEAQGNRDKANRAFNLSNRLQKNRNNGQLYDPNSEESASEYRRNSYAYTNGFDKGWDKGRHQMEEATADPRWWQKDGEFPDMKDDAYSRPKQQVKVSEAQLHQIVKESVEQIMNEAYSDAQYAHLAGQAHGALNSFGGRLKGMFNPKWKGRKERQMRNFANQATRQNFGYENSSTKGGDHNDGDADYRMPNHNYTWSNGGQADYIENSFNQKNHESPFEMKRHQRYVTVDDPSKPISGRSSRAMANDGDVYSRDETRNIASQHADKDEWNRYEEMEKLRDSNSMLNRAFQQGQQARKGRTYKTVGGGTYTNGTGTSSGAFKRLK